jgi:zinc/manganese transport system substrate-binding protein
MSIVILQTMIRLLSTLAAAAAGLAFAGSAGAATVQVVAAENFWGSIASQLGGAHAQTQSIIVNPNVDPHSYEPEPSDARAFAASQLAIVNGIGYDQWASQLLDAEPSSSRVVVDVGDVLGLHEGDNPHQWYSPSSVNRVVAAITAAYVKLDPGDKAYFERRKHSFETKGLARYHALIKEIRRRYRGVPVGYSESIFAPLGSALGLRLLTPYSFAKAVAEGSEISVGDLRTVDRQASSRQIKVWIFNSQNVTPDVQHVNELAKAHHIPIVTVTETLSPATLSFQAWQVRELTALLNALHRATGR